MSAFQDIYMRLADLMVDALDPGLQDCYGPLGNSGDFSKTVLWHEDLHRRSSDES